MDNKRLKFYWGRMGWTAAFVLIAALFITGAAFAESGEPEPTEPPQEITQAPVEDEAAASDEVSAPPVEEAPAEEPPAEESATLPDSETPPPPAEEGAAAAEIEDEEAASAEGSSAEVVEAAAESGALLVDELGEELDLASHATAELLASGDPYYWVGTKKYAFVYDDADCPADAFYCQADLDPIDAALAYMDTTGLPSNRLLYVERGTYDGFTINGEGSILSLLKGVIGVDGSEVTTINGDTSIFSTVSGFTLQGFTFSSGAGVAFGGNRGTLNIKDVVVKNSNNDYGIKVSGHSGAINLDSVQANNNSYSGALLENYSSTSPITVTNSVFSGNGSSGIGDKKGLVIGSIGAVTLNDIVAQNNDSDGIKVSHYSTLEVKHAILSNNISSNEDLEYMVGFGLYAYTNGKGTAYLEDVRANDNYYGIWIDGGSLKAKDVEANRNADDGLYFNSKVGSSLVEFGSFNDNGFNGMYIRNKGATCLNSIQANNNNLNGLYLGSRIYGDTGYFIGSGIFTLNGIVAQNNKANGIKVFHYRTLKVNHAILTNNISSIEEIGGENKGSGLFAWTWEKGTAYLEDVHANENNYGIYILGGSLKAKDVKANGNVYGEGLFFYSEVGSSRVEFSSFNDNFNSTGLSIINKGAIYLNSIQANGNGSSGLYLSNFFYSHEAEEYIGSGSVTLTSPKSGGWQLTNGFRNNGDTGVTIYSRGAVTVANVEIVDNGGLGLKIDNTYGNGGVTLNNMTNNRINWINGNSGVGIFIRSNGAVKLANTQALWNQFNGIDVITKGNIELANINASDNLGWGAKLDNSGGTLPRTVKITDSRFDGNQGYGLSVFSRGAISANGLSASGNSNRNLYIGEYEYGFKITYHDLLGDGWVEDSYTFYGESDDTVDIYLSSDDFDGYLELWGPSGWLDTSDDDGWDGNEHINITLGEDGYYTIIVRSNDSAGEYLLSLNDSTQLINVQTNIYHGAYLNNHSGTAGVTIKKPKNLDNLWGNFFDHNTGDGIFVYSNGSISLDSLDASNNFQNGLNLPNPASRASVSVLNTRTDGFYSSFSNNSSLGINIATLGNVTIKNIGAWENCKSGLYIDNLQGGAGFGSVKVLASPNQGNHFPNNGENGLQIISNGSITMVNVDAFDNYGDGASLNNAGSSSTAGISITWGNFWGNGAGTGATGLTAASNGSITWKFGGAWENGGDGASLINTNGSGSVTVAGSNKERMWFGYNGSSGLIIESKGQITLQYAYADYNGADGFNLDNFSSLLNKNVNITEVGMDNNSQSGLLVSSKGAISIKGIDAYSNGQYGAYLDNHEGVGGVTVTTTSTWTGNDFDGNTSSGLYILSAGAVSMKNISASGNHANGIEVDNTSGTSPVTYQSTGKEIWLTDNGSISLQILSNGNVTLNNQYGLNSYNNYGEYGIYIDNSNSSTPMYVKLINVGASNNNSDTVGDGLHVQSSGYIYASSLAADTNHGYGAYLYSESGAVTIAGSNYFRDNGAVGLCAIADYGSVSLSNASAQWNGEEGVFLKASNGNITVTSVSAANNDWTGVRLDGTGNFTINKVTAFNNGLDDGGDLTDDGLSILANSSASAVSIINSAFMANLNGSGIEIDHPTSGFLPYLYNTYYLGNGEANLNVHT